MENIQEILRNEGEMLEKKGNMLENEEEMLSNEGEMSANGGAKVKIDIDLLNCVKARDPFFESEKDLSENLSRENDPLQQTGVSENEPLVKTEREENYPYIPFMHTESPNDDSQLHIQKIENDPLAYTQSREKDLQLRTERRVKDPSIHAERAEKDPLVKTERENDLVINPNFSNFDPPEYTASREQNPLVKTESEEIYSLVSDNVVKCEPKSKSLCMGKVASGMVVQAKVLDYETIGRHVLEGDGIETYIRGSEEILIVKEDDVWNCSKSESDSCYPNFKDNPKGDNVWNCPRAESDPSHSNLQESREEGGNESIASRPNFKERESRLTRPTKQANCLRNRLAKNSDKLMDNSSTYLRNKGSKQTTTETTIKFTCRKCTCSFPSKAELKKHLQLHVRIDSHTNEFLNINYSEIIAKEREKCLKTRQRHPKTTTVETVQESLCFSDSEKHSDILIKDSNISHENLLAKTSTADLTEKCNTQDCRTKDDECPAVKRHKKIDNVVESVCGDCGESFTQEDLEKHSITCTALEKYECQKCGMKFRFKSSFEEHFEIHKTSVSYNQVFIIKPRGTRRGIYKCSTCSYESIGLEKIMSHVPVHFGNEWSTHLENTYEVNNPNKMFQCQLCTNNFVKKRHRKEYHHSPFTIHYHFECLVCRKQFAEKADVNAHYDCHCDDIKYLITQVVSPWLPNNYIQESGTSSSVVKREALYNRLIVIKPRGTPSNVYKCSTCCLEYTSLNKVMSHSPVHLGNEWCTHLENTNVVDNLGNLFQCQLCIKFSIKKLNRNGYYQTVHYHFECLKCHEHFVERSNVYRHQECHDDDITYLITQVVSPWAPKKRPEEASLLSQSFKCQECQQAFDQMLLLATHLVTAHPTKFRRYTPQDQYRTVFKCLECKLNILDQAAYFGHLLAHSGSK